MARLVNFMWVDRGGSSVSIFKRRFGMWVVVKLMVPFWVPIVRHLLFRVPKKGP